MFKTIKASNLFSWKDLNYEIEPGIAQITGYNYDDGTAEASGKSSILNILCWTLYGAIPKEVKIDEVIREGETSGQASVLCLDGTWINRSRKPNQLFMTDAVGNKIEGKDAKETQKLIVAFLGMDFDTFCQTVYFSQSYYKKFISANEADKAKILSEIQDLSIFDRARKQVQESIKSDSNLKDSLEHEVELCGRDLERHSSTIKVLEEHIKSAKERLTSQRNSILRNLESLKVSLKESEEYLIALKEGGESNHEAEISTMRGELDTLRGLQNTLTNRRNNYSKECQALTRQENMLERLSQSIKSKKAKLLSAVDKPTRCPGCGGEINEAQKRVIAKELDVLRNEIAELESEESQERTSLLTPPEPFNEGEYTKVTSTIKTLQQLIDTYIEADAKNKAAASNCAALIKSKESQIRQLNSDLESLNNYNSDKEEANLSEEARSLAQTTAKLEQLDLEITTIKDKLGKLELLKDGFKEIKSYVFQNLLNELSNKSTLLAREMFEVPVSIRFTNDTADGGVAKIQTQVTLDGHTRSLGLFSGGQFKRLELSIDLALSQIVSNRSHKPMNFRIFDEPFKDLSLTSMQRVVSLLKGLEGATIVIEHNDLIKTVIDRVFHVEYRNGVSIHAAQNL